MRHRFLARNTGLEREAVVLETRGPDGRVRVLTENYLTVLLEGPLPAGEIVRVQVRGPLGMEVLGEKVP
jgi:hypothetical protein